MALTLDVNGKTHEVEVDATAPLLYVLRNDLGLNGPKFGCGLAQCGSCTVLMDGKALRCCVVQSTSWTLEEAVSFDRERVRSRDWASYPILTFDDVPTIEVELIDRPEEPPVGAGEAAQGPMAVAIANAVFVATGVRIRDLPLDPTKLRIEKS